MRKIQIIFAAVSAFGLSVPAPVAAIPNNETFSPNPNLSAEDELCVSIGVLAEMVMRARQDGVSAPTIIDRVAQGSEADALLKAMVKWAFALPRERTASARDNAVSEFSSEAYLSCLNSSDEQG